MISLNSTCNNINITVPSQQYVLPGSLGTTTYVYA